MGSRQGDDRFRLGAAQERRHGFAANAVDAHAEGDGTLLERGHQPRGGIAAVKHEQIMLAEQLKVFPRYCHVVR
jgi:hypothetical protein